jgi:hypothetical protein
MDSFPWQPCLACAISAISLFLPRLSKPGYRLKPLTQLPARDI